jgi:hypothetical protein
MTNPNSQECAILKELGMGQKDYGVMYRDEYSLRLLCFATRDYVWIKRNPPGGSEFDAPRELDAHEAQILRENGMDPTLFVVTYRDAHSIEVRKMGTTTYVLIWKGDRKW